MSHEEWRQIPGRDFEVSNMGNIRLNGEILLVEASHGKSVWREGYRFFRKRKVAHWVLEAFVGPYIKGTLSCHKNDIRSDDRLDNLYWGTKRDNIVDSYRNGRIDKEKQRKAAAGRRHSEDTKQKIREAVLNMSEETHARMSASAKKRIRLKGAKRSKESREKMYWSSIKRWSKKWLQKEADMINRFLQEQGAPPICCP